MGEIAEAMLDGTLCQGCGVYLGSDDSFPQYCFSCQRDERKDAEALKKENERIGKKALEALTNVIEKEYDAGFSPAIYQHVSAQIMGIARQLYLNGNGAISHHGMQHTIDNNRASMKAAQKRKAKNSNRPKDE